MAVLNKEQILSVDDLLRQEIEVPEWGGSVYVRVMSGSERDAFEARFVGGANAAALADIRATLAALAVCDANGKRLFTDAEVKVLGAKSAKALDRIFEVACRLNGIRQEDIEQLEGN